LWLAFSAAMNRKAPTGSTPWPRKRTTVRVAGVRTAPDLVDRDFGPDAAARIARGRSPTRIMGEIGPWGEKYLQIDGFECGASTPSGTDIPFDSRGFGREMDPCQNLPVVNEASE